MHELKAELEECQGLLDDTQSCLEVRVRVRVKVKVRVRARVIGLGLRSQPSQLQHAGNPWFEEISLLSLDFTAVLPLKVLKHESATRGRVDSTASSYSRGDMGRGRGDSMGADLCRDAGYDNEDAEAWPN